MFVTLLAVMLVIIIYLQLAPKSLGKTETKMMKTRFLLRKRSQYPAYHVFMANVFIKTESMLTINSHFLSGTIFNSSIFVHFLALAIIITPN